MSSFTPLRWGIIGCGSIANRLGNDVARLEDHQLQAIASRDASKAEAYAEKFGVLTQHTGPDAYTNVVNDPDVDIIYIATPHNFHKEQALMAIAAGKPVLCEKPFTVNTAEAEVVIAAAREKGTFLMEGVWSRCFPVWRKVMELIGAGEIGHARMLYSDFGYRAGNLGDDHRLTGYNAEGRLFNRNLIGVLGNSGVDENVGVVMAYANGEVATATTSIQVTTPFTTTILGTAGRIEVESPWWRPKAFVLHRDGNDAERFSFEHEGEGFQFEAMEIADCLRAGKTESSVMPLSDTLSVMRSLDAVRAQLGLVYPGE